jgi:hypothetical protein
MVPNIGTNKSQYLACCPIQQSVLYWKLWTTLSHFESDHQAILTWNRAVFLMLRSSCPLLCLATVIGNSEAYAQHYRFFLSESCEVALSTCTTNPLFQRTEDCGDRWLLSGELDNHSSATCLHDDWWTPPILSFRTLSRIVWPTGITGILKLY